MLEHLGERIGERLLLLHEADVVVRDPVLRGVRAHDLAPGLELQRHVSGHEAGALLGVDDDGPDLCVGTGPAEGPPRHDGDPVPDLGVGEAAAQRPLARLVHERFDGVATVIHAVRVELGQPNGIEGDDDRVCSAHAATVRPWTVGRWRLSDTTLAGYTATSAFQASSE